MSGGITPGLLVNEQSWRRQLVDSKRQARGCLARRITSATLRTARSTATWVGYGDRHRPSSGDGCGRNRGGKLLPRHEAPTNLVATSTAPTRIDLTWTNTANDATSISVERCRGAVCTKFKAVAKLGATANSWTDFAVTSGATYRYRVRASNAQGNSPYSNIAKVKAR